MESGVSAPHPLSAFAGNRDPSGYIQRLPRLQSKSDEWRAPILLKNFRGESIVARINIEDQFWLDLMTVIERMGDKDKAAGNAIRFMRFSQEKHRKGLLLSEEEFRDKEFNEALIGVFAERVDGGIQAIGASKHFAWLDAKTKAGSKGGKSKAGAKTKHLKQNTPKQNVAKPSDTEPSLSLSLSLSDSSSPENLAKGGLSPQGVYVKAYWIQYGHRPAFGPREGKILKQFALNHATNWQALIEGYFAMPSVFLTERSHPVELLPSKANEIARFISTGKVVTSADKVKMNEKLDDAMGPKPPRIEEILAKRKNELGGKA